MINVDTLAIVLRVLGRTEPTRSPAPVAGVARAAQVKALTVDRALSPTANEQLAAATLDTPIAFEDHTAQPEQRVIDHGGAPDANPSRPEPPGRDRQSTSMPGPASASRIALSPAGSVLLDALKAPDEHGTPAVHPRSPLLASPPSSGSSLAHALERSITRSGMFYESHLARWAHDDFPVDELAHEPQFHWNAAPTAEMPTQPRSAPHADAPLMLRQQLEAHEAHRVALDAQLWPGQQARIVFEEAGHTREHTSQGPAHAVPPGWNARIDIVLDSLGPVSATLALRDGRLHVRLDAGKNAAHRLRHASRELEQTLAASGIDLAGFSIDHG